MAFAYSALSKAAQRKLLTKVDPGVRPYVDALLGAGVETFESCEGGKGHAFPEPTVRFHGDNGAGFKAFSVALTYGLPVLSVRRSYLVSDGTLTGPFWEMTFRRKAQQ